MDVQVKRCRMTFAPFGIEGKGEGAPFRVPGELRHHSVFAEGARKVRVRSAEVAPHFQVAVSLHSLVANFARDGIDFGGDLWVIQSHDVYGFRLRFLMIHLEDGLASGVCGWSSG